ncbi:hypothetical protein [Brevibacillus sp. NRS-1366]|uniref:hypothetical protein n=1 Tax=Brevibacillus sp. NRS-1366 TaxID=3233899 RepID=UPI003D2309CB
MAKQVHPVAEKLGLIAQAEAEYEALLEEIREHCQKARELRQQADKMSRSGSSEPHVATEIRKLVEQAEYFDRLADQKDGLPRLEAIRRIEDLQREVCCF